MKQQLPALGVWLGKIPSFALCIAVLATLCAPALVQIAGLSTDPSFLDNRPPTPFPPLPRSIAGVEKFRDGVNKFIDDNFGLRAELVKLNVLVHSWVGVSSIPSLVMGRDGWFFLKTDVAVLDQFRGLNRFTDAEMDSWIDTMDRYRRWLERQGIAFMVVVAPNQQTVYPEYMPGYANRVWPETRLDQISRRLRERKSELNFVDLRPALWAARGEKGKGLLFHKYENHWNNMGGFVGYSAIMRHVKQVFQNIRIMQLSDYNIGSVDTAWSIPPLTEKEPAFYLKTSSKVKATDVIMRVNNTDFVKTTTANEDAPNLFIYGDSFAGALMPYFQETFASVISVASAHAKFPTELIQKHHSNFVIYELVERYLALPLPDNRDLDADLLLRGAPSLEKLISETAGRSGGYIDGFTLEGDNIRFSGWAVDPAAKAPATVIYAYAADRAVAVAKPNHLRPDLTQGMADGMIGFQMTAPKDAIVRTPYQRPRFFTLNPSKKVYELIIDPPLVARLDALLGKL